MFTDIELLYRQHGGRFGIAWNASIRGIKFIPSKQIMEFDIIRICEDIMKYIASNSSMPKKRMSLRLVATLTNGVVKIFKQQVNICEDEVIRFISRVTVPLIFENISFIESRDIFREPESPIPIGKRKRRVKKAVEVSPDIIGDFRQALDTLEQQTAKKQTPTARITDITIQEDLPIRRPEEQIEGFGEIGGLILPDALVRTSQEIMQIDLPFYNEQPAEKDLKERESSSPDAPVDQIVTCIAQVLRENEPIDQTQQIDETILVQHHMHQIPDIVVIQPEVQQQSEVSVQVVPQDTLMPDVQPEVVPSEFTIEVEQPRNAARPRNVVGSSEEERIRRIRKQYETSPVESLEVGPLQNFINRKRRIPRFVKINRWNYGDSYKRKYPSIETLIRAAVKPDPAFAVFKPEMVFDDVRGVHSISGQTTRGSSLRISATDRTDSLGTPQADLAKTYMYQSTPLKRPSSQEVELGSHGKQQKLMELEPSLIENIQAPVLEQVSVSIVPMEQVPEVSAIPGQDTLAEQPIAHVEQTLVEEHVPVPVLMERDIIEEVIPIEVRVEEQLIIPELEKTTTVVEIAPTVKKVDPKVYFENRHKGILNKVKSWNIEEQGILGLEEIAEKPLTKLTVARAFSDVLQLCKLRYLVLYPEEDSNQLRSIEKGSKLC